MSTYLWAVWYNFITNQEDENHGVSIRAMAGQTLLMPQNTRTSNQKNQSVRHCVFQAQVHHTANSHTSRCHHQCV